MSDAEKNPARTVRVRMLALLLLPILAVLSACKPAATDYFSYRSTDFSACLEGNRGGKPFACEVVCRGGAIESIRYTAPASLAGLLLECTERGVHAERDGIGADFAAAQLAGLLEPVRLLLLEGGELLSVQRIPEGMLLSVACPQLPSPVTVTLLSNGYPSVVSAGNISFRVVELAEFRDSGVF